MKINEKEKYKFNIILSLIGIIISLIFLIIEIIFKNDYIFWLTLLICNLGIFLGNYYGYKKM